MRRVLICGGNAVPKVTFTATPRLPSVLQGSVLDNLQCVKVLYCDFISGFDIIIFFLCYCFPYPTVKMGKEVKRSHVHFLPWLKGQVKSSA